MNKLFAAAICLAILTTSELAAQDFSCERNPTEVSGLSFEGNKTFSDAELGSVIITTPSSWVRRRFHLPFSARRCLDPEELRNDRLRLILFYRKRGFPHVEVDTLSEITGADRLRIRFLISEGPPVILRSLTVVGLDSVEGGAEILSSLPLREGDRFDRVRIEEVMDSVTRRLRNIGYPGVTAENRYAISAQEYADDTIFIATGSLTRIGRVEVTVTPAPNRERQIRDKVVKNILGIDSGDVYREARILAAQRSLYETDAYWHVTIELDSASGRTVNGDSVVTLSVSLVENMMKSARIGLGYGTLDCFRATGELDNYNFLNEARRLELRGRVSKIGVGEPLEGASSLCPQARNDPYSDRLNYYAGATWRQPVFFGGRTVPTITAYTQRISEYNAYVRTTSIGGIASLVWRRSARAPVTFAYSMDYGRTEAQPSLFCAVFNICTGEDRERVQNNQRLGVVSTSLQYNRTNHPTSPSSGSMAKIEYRHASPWVLSDSALRFNTVVGEIAKYIGLNSQMVLALNLRAGTVLGRDFKPGTSFIPPHERMYGGGPTSLRGFRQNELGAVAYTARGFTVDSTSVPGSYFLEGLDSSGFGYRRAVPVGGNSMVVGNIELRFRTPLLPKVLEFAVFTDAGDVWNRGSSSAFRDFHLKVTPGMQMAAHTPIGPVRVMVGYNPYKKVSGPLYYEAGTAGGGALPCVSPGNNLRAMKNAVTGEWEQEEGSCPATFTPQHKQNFRSKLTLNLAIGQAF